MTTDHNEAMKLADLLMEAHRGHSDEGPSSFSEAAALLRKQAERIAELEARVHTCGPTCSKAGCINRRLTAERDTLRARLAGIASLAHAGGAVGLSAEAAQTEIRRICLPHWDRSAAPQALRTAIDTARKATQ